MADLGPSDFAKLRVLMVKKWGAVRVGNVIQRVRTIFKFGWESELIKPVSFGPGFKKPSKKVMRKVKAAKGRGMARHLHQLRRRDARQ